MVNRPAGFWIRLGAVILDGLLVGVSALIISTIIGLDSEGGEIFNGIIEVLYSLLLPVLWYGYTVGKRICGIRIVKLDGSNVGIGTMLLRNLVAAFVYIVTFGIALIVSVFMVAFRQDKRGVHDMIARTYVTYEKPGEVNPYQEV